MNHLHYYATDLREFVCDNCDKHIGYGFIDHCDDCGMLCDTCKSILEIKQAPEIERNKLERLMRFYEEMECGLSKDGHDWHDITQSCMVIGCYVYSCSKCPADKTKPYDLSHLNFTIGGADLILNEKRL